MPKLTKWAETIVWKSYPDCKPVNDGYYWFLFSSKDGSNYTLQTKWKDGYLKHLDDDEDVIAFAELPTGSIGDEFGFETAVLLMKEGVYCSPISDNLIVKHKSYTICNMNGELHFSVGNNTQSVNISASEILGKWRLA